MIAVLLSNWRLILLAALLGVIGVQEMRIDHAHAETAKVQAAFDLHLAQDAEAAEKAEAANRQTEQEREQLKDQIIDQATHATELAKADAAASAAAADGLRKQLATYIAAVHQATSDPKPAGPSAPASTALDLLAELLNRSSDVQQELAGFADQSRIAGLACENWADGLQLAK